MLPQEAVASELNGNINVGSITYISGDLYSLIPFNEILEDERLEYYIYKNNQTNEDEVIYTNNTFGFVMYVDITKNSIFDKLEFDNNYVLSIKPRLSLIGDGTSYIPEIASCTLLPKNNFSLSFQIKKQVDVFSIALKTSLEISLYKLASFDNTINNEEVEGSITKERCVPIICIMEIDINSLKDTTFNAHLNNYTLNFTISLSK